MDKIMGLLYFQFIVWVFFNFFMLIVELKPYKNYQIIGFNQIYNYFSTKNLRNIWVFVFTILSFIIVFPFTFWFWFNSLPFKFIYFIMIGEVTDKTIKKILFKS